MLNLCHLVLLKEKKEQGDEQEKITKKISKMIKSNEDVNNVILKQINDGLDKAETKLDEKIYGKTEIKVKVDLSGFIKQATTFLKLNGMQALKIVYPTVIILKIQLIIT